MMTRLRTSTSFVALPLNAAAPPLGNLEGAQPSPSMPCTSNLGPETSPHQLHPLGSLGIGSETVPKTPLASSSSIDQARVNISQLSSSSFSTCKLLLYALVSSRALGSSCLLALLHSFGCWDASGSPPFFPPFPLLLFFLLNQACGKVKRKLFKNYSLIGV